MGRAAEVELDALLSRRAAEAFDAVEGAGLGDQPVVVEIVGWPEWRIEGQYTPDEMNFDWRIALDARGSPGEQVFRVVDYQLDYIALP